MDKQLEQLDDASDFATWGWSGGNVDIEYVQHQQLLAFTGTLDQIANLTSATDGSFNLADGEINAPPPGTRTNSSQWGDLVVGEGVVAHNIFDMQGSRAYNVSGLSRADDPVVITGFGKANNNVLAATTEGNQQGNLVQFSNALGFGMTGMTGWDLNGNNLRINDGEALNFSIRQDQVLSEASFTVRTLNAAMTTVVLDSDGKTLADTNGTSAGGFVQDRSAGEFAIGGVRDGAVIRIDYLTKQVFLDGALVTAGAAVGGTALGGSAAFFATALGAGTGALNLTLGSVLGNQIGYTVDNLVLTTKAANELSEIGAGGNALGAVVEDDQLSASGQIFVTDVEVNPKAFQTPAGAVGAGAPDLFSVAGTYGTFTFNVATGEWSYALSNASTAVQGLTSLDTRYEELLVTSWDGTAQETITVTVGGQDDEAVITDATSGSVEEDVNVQGGKLTATGKLDIADADAGQAAFSTAATPVGAPLGAFSIDANGNYSYSVANAAVQYLAGGQTLIEQFTVSSLDGSATKTLSFTTVGANDAATISGTKTGSVTEDSGVVGGNLTFADTLSVIDADLGQASFSTTVTAVGSVLGSLTIAANGGYAYSVSNVAVQYLGATGSKTEEFTVTSADGTQETLSFTINGANDPASITGTTSGAVTEDTGVVGGNLVFAGQITANDADQGQSGFQTTATPVGSVLGSLTIGADGSYAYSVSNAAVQYLNSGQTKLEQFTVRALDGTSQTLSFAINGADEPPTNQLAVVNDLVYASNGTNVVLPWSVFLANDTVSANAAITAISDVTGNSLSNGVSLSAANKTVSFNTSGNTETGSFKYTVSDGGSTRTGTVTVEMRGTNGSEQSIALSSSYAAAFLDGKGGQDTLTGSDAELTLTGGGQRDWFLGGDGDDRLFGNEGDDVLSGGEGQDRLLGGDGNDSLSGGRADDTLEGGDGNDLLSGGDNNDRLFGDAGDDSLDGGGGNDLLTGGGGNDTLNGDQGNDSLVGGTGDNVFVFGDDFDNDVVTDFSRAAPGGFDRLALDDTIFSQLTFQVSGGNTIIRSSGWNSDDSLTIQNFTATSTQWQGWIDFI